MIDILKALLTPVIAGVTTYIAWQQWKINKYKFKLEIYDRRLHVYEEVKKVFSIVERDANVSKEYLFEFRASVSEADFLFGKEITQYINEIYKHGLNLYRLNREYKDFTQPTKEGYDHKDVAKRDEIEITWFSEQSELAKEKFKKYMDLSK